MKYRWLLASGIGAIAFGALVWASLADCVGVAWAGGGACRSKCERAYARCYKDTGADSQTCRAQYRQCLERCLRTNKIN